MKSWRVGVAIAAVVLVGACGGDDGDGDASTSTSTTVEASSGQSSLPSSDVASSSGSTAAADGSVVVEHLYGTTTIEGTPQRIVSYDPQWTDVLAALDAPVVGALFNPDGPRYPWQGGILPDTEEIAYAQDGIPLERIAALDPDLIVTSWEATDEATYELLSDIAPTIPLLGDRGVDAWQDLATVAGHALGQEEAAAELVTDAEGESAAVVEELPGLDGKTYVLANYVAGDGIYLVADPDDGAGVFFAQLGMQIAPQVLGLPSLSEGRAKISVEEIGLLDADLLVLLTNGVDATTIPGYSALPAVQSGAVSLLDVADVSALNTPSPLSVPYALDLIQPALEAAAG